MDESIIIQPQPIRNHALYRRESAYPAFVGTKEECIAMRKSWSHKALREGWTLTEHDGSPIAVKDEELSPAQRAKNFLWILLGMTCFWLIALTAFLL